MALLLQGAYVTLNAKRIWQQQRRYNEYEIHSFLHLKSLIQSPTEKKKKAAADITECFLA